MRRSVECPSFGDLFPRERRGLACPWFPESMVAMDSGFQSVLLFYYMTSLGLWFTLKNGLHTYKNNSEERSRELQHGVRNVLPNFAWYDQTSQEHKATRHVRRQAWTGTSEPRSLQRVGTTMRCATRYWSFVRGICLQQEGSIARCMMVPQRFANRNLTKDLVKRLRRLRDFLGRKA